jgi:DNA repair photolyase
MKESTGNMYPWVTHTHVHLGGECPHKCVYCYVNNPRFGRPPKYCGPLRLIEKEFSVDYGSGKTIFTENCNDLFAKEVPQAFINRIIAHCLKYPLNTYIFQTKNPARYLTMDELFPDKSLLGCTIETNRDFVIKLSQAPSPAARISAMTSLNKTKFVTLEPILDFDVLPMFSALRGIKPDFVNIGADSKGHRLLEPPIEKVDHLIELLQNAGIEIREKHNLERLRK